MSGDSDDLVFHMRRVQSAQRDLRDLGVVWQMIESSAAISCPEEIAPILPTLVRTRERFDTLQTELIERMADEHRAELGDELGARAQCAIDILVRNLYERTADVGFLATDDVVRAYCSATAAERDSGRPAMQRRLQEYRAKYTVYDDVVLLAPGGELLVRLDDARPLARSGDPIVGEALAAGSWIERFGASDLSADAGPSLRYAHRIAGADGRAVGVLVLRFRFIDEMRRIFQGVADTRQQVALVLIDAEQRVIASNDEAHVPIGARLMPVDDRRVVFTSFAGREYLAVRCPSHGYQGYAGPGWRAQAMVSLLTAFRHRDEEDDGTDVPLDHAQLAAIHRDADAINRELRRVVWNGRLMADAQLSERRRLQAVLHQVNRAGARTRSRVERAIRDLYRTSLSRARNQALELATLASDILDRNLYERANDCRWWALSPAIQRALEADAGEDATVALNKVLDHINGLYTVYSRLVVFDAEGRIRGASGGAEALVGQAIEPAWLAAVQALNDSQRYAVSDYAPTPLHEHGETYTFLAAVRAAGDARRLAGGIAIVFHAQRELHAMLSEVIGERTGFAAFVDARGHVLAATDAALAALAAQQLPRGTGVGPQVRLAELGQVHYACVRVRTGGYREFKTSDGYDNQVDTLVALRLGASERRRGAMGDIALEAGTPGAGGRVLEVAIFHVGAGRYALPAAAVMEATGAQGLVRTPGAQGRALGLLEVRAGGRSRLVPVVCARRQFGVNYPARATDGVVLVLRSPQCPDQPAFGLRVDDVITVLESDEQALHPVPAGFPRHSPWVERLFDARVSAAGGAGSSVLVQVLSPSRVAEDVLNLAVAGASPPAAETQPPGAAAPVAAAAARASGLSTSLAIGG